jgi:hydroxymethylpyrimidine pyrophosphatase-like HAD family hydrolase
LGVCIEISSIFASNKGTTLKFLSAYYGIPLEQCIVFGDGDNDVLGLRKALFGFAVKNASLSAKLCARRVLK